MTVASQPEHDFHGFGHYDWCPECRAARTEQQEIDAAANLTEITHLVAVVTDNIDEAEQAIAKAKAAVTDLVSDRVYDVELAEGSAGTDCLIELATIACSLRHVRRIMIHRADLLRASRQAADDLGEVGVVLGETGVDADTALDRIQHWLRDPQYGSGMLEDIAEVVRSTGRTTDNYPDERSTWARH